MKSIKFFSDHDLQQIDDNLDNIEIEATKLKYKTLDPTNDEYNKVKSLVLNFIETQKRIVYGGTAYHAIIQHYRKDNNTEKQIYPDWERYDTEFYSPLPIRDMVMLCNTISNNDIKYVMGRQAQHDETFTIFANFLQYCDISYMPNEIFSKIQTIEINNIKYIHPEYILIDIFRMFNDPLTSAWRFNKTFKRMKLLMEHYPFDFHKADSIIFEKNEQNNAIIDSIIPQLLKNYDNILFTGQLAYLLYTNPDKNINSSQINQIEIVVDNYDEIVDYVNTSIYKWFSETHKHEFKNFDKLFMIRKYSRFFQYWDQRTVFFYKNKPFMTILGNANRCIPFNNSIFEFSNNKYDVKIGSFLVTFNYYLIAYHYELINNQGFYFSDRNFINSLITSKTEYLESKNKSVIDNTIYKDFILTCIGKTTEFTREFLLRMSEKRSKGAKGLLSYDPITARETYIEYPFEQSDGLVI